MHTNPGWILSIVSVIACVTDLASKAWATATLTPKPLVSILGSWVQFHWHENPGLAFSIGAAGGQVIRVLPLVVILGLSMWLGWRWYKDDLRWPEAGAFGLILGGGVANVLDRLHDGVVTDFIDVEIGSTRWPTFNLADTWIVLGSIWLGWHTLQTSRHTLSARIQWNLIILNGWRLRIRCVRRFNAGMNRRCYSILAARLRAYKYWILVVVQVLELMVIPTRSCDIHPCYRPWSTDDCPHTPASYRGTRIIGLSLVWVMRLRFPYQPLVLMLSLMERFCTLSPEWSAAIAEIARVLRPGRRLFFTEVTRHALERWIYRTFFVHPTANRFNPTMFYAMLAQHGIDVGTRHRERFFRWFYARCRLSHT